MNVENIIEDAYETWRKAYGFFVAHGILAYLVFAILVTITVLVTGIDPNNITSAPLPALAVFAIVYALALLFKHVYLLIVAYEGRKKRFDINSILQTLRERFVHVGITVLLVVLALVTGGLLAEFFAFLSIYGNPAADFIGVFLLLLFLYIALRFSLAPYYAVKIPWDEAIQRSLKRTREHFISVLLIELFFSLLTVFLISLNPALYLVVDAFFLAHLVNLTLFNLVEARR